MADEQTLEGWEPETDGVPLAEVVDKAFEYRGDVNVVQLDGTSIVGYLYNRRVAGAESYVDLIETKTETRLRIPYSAIRTIRFTGRDMAAGKSHDAWLRRRETHARATRARD